MARLTQRQTRALENLIDKLQRANNKLYSKDTAFCVRKNQATTTLDYSNKDGNVLYEVAREYGSEVSMFKDVEIMLKNFVQYNTQEKTI